MGFNTAEYLVFYCAALAAGWLLVSRTGLRIWVLLLASYYFYVSNNHWLIFLILLSTFIDYGCAIGIEQSASRHARKSLLVLSVCLNLGLLGLFKYFDFFAGSIVEVARALGVELSWTELHLMLPVGISFYTFQSMSYTIDVYRGDIPAERSWPRFALFVAYFPQLVAGPIVRPATFLPQLDERPRLDAQALELSLMLIFRGLWKKIVLGDFLAGHVDPVFENPSDASAIAAWLAVYAFTFQIYFDFSGYTDVAIGCARLMGFRLPDNFRRPYASASLTEFWRRWHISLSTWLRDYLYIPLGGARGPGRFAVYRNLMLTMLLGGLWHGAAWNFVLWGAFHGGGLVVERALGIRPSRERRASLRASDLARQLLTFHLVCLGWMLFRADDVSTVGQVLAAMTGPLGTASPSTGMAAAALIIVLGALTQLAGDLRPLDRSFLALPLPLKGLVYGAVAVAVMVCASAEMRPFIYFRF